MYCFRCGAALPESARFCPTCGIAQPPAGVPEIAPSITPPPASAFQPQSVPQVRPWVRYWARMADLFFFALPAGFMLGLLAPGTFDGETNDYALGILILLLWVFVEPLCLSVFGTTPGKWLLRIRLLTAQGGRPTYGEALARSLKVWVRGLGFGLPLVSLITLVLSWRRLRENATTTWDAEGGFTVQHGAIGIGRSLLAIAFFLGYFLLIGIAKEL